MNVTENVEIACPKLFPIPEESIHRIVDEGMLQYEASVSGLKERYRRGETSHTGQVWWARRPHSAMRALVFAALSQNVSNEAVQIMATLANCEAPSNEVLKRAEEIISSGGVPKLLDIFGGGGTIASEAARIGAKAYSCDVNELACYIQRTNLTYSQLLKQDELFALIQNSGERILNNLTQLTRDVFPPAKSMIGGGGNLFSEDVQPLAYLWSYARTCSKCQYKFLLIKRPWLSKKRERKTAFRLKDDFESNAQTVEIIETDDSYEFISNWSGRNGIVTCPKCKTIHDGNKISDLEDCLIGIIVKTKKGKSFLTPEETSYQCPSLNYMKEKEAKLLESLGKNLPETKLPKWSGIVNPALYGIEEHKDLLNQRQRIFLLALMKEIKDEYKVIVKKHGVGIAKSVVAFLSGLVDQAVDWNCRLSMWISQNEQVGRALCGPGLPMYWDYVEIDGVRKGPANLWDKLERISKGAKSIGGFTHKPEVSLAPAQKLPFPKNTFDAVVTDPPYYDNIYYSILADCIYPWKRMLLEDIEVELFSNRKTSSEKELVASTFRSGTPEKAHGDYCVELAKAINEAERVLKKNGVFCFIYSHSSSKGWDALIQAFRPSNFFVTSVQPLSIERKERPRAMTSLAVNTCLTFVAHKSNVRKGEVTIKEILKNIESIRDNFMKSLTSSGWEESDVALAIFANGIGLLTNFNQVKRGEEIISNETCIEAIEAKIQEKFPEFKIQKRGSL